MNLQNQDTISSPPPAANDLLAKRKRGRPRKDENSTHVTPKPDVNLVGKMVSGAVEGSFDAGYFLNVKVKDSDTKLRGVVFIPGRVNPITPDNDVAPHVKMYKREEIKNSQTDQSLPSDQPMKEADATPNLEISESVGGLSLMPQGSNGEFSAQAKEAMMEKDGVMVQGKEAMMEKNGAMVQAKDAMKERDGVMEEAAATRLVEFFPTPETMITTVQPNLVLVEKEQQKSSGETRGFDLMAEEPVRLGSGEKVPELGPGEKVPEELLLELGNKKIVLNGDNNNNNSITTSETDPKSSVSKSGFIANLFEGEDKKVDNDSNMEKEKDATPSKQ